MSVEQRINQKFLVRLRTTPTEALKLLQEVYADDTMSRTGGAESQTWARGQLKCELRKRRRKCRIFVTVFPVEIRRSKKKKNKAFSLPFRWALWSPVGHVMGPLKSMGPCVIVPLCPPSRRPCRELVFLSGTGGSKRKERRSKIITGVGGHPQAEQIKCWACETKRAERSRFYS